MQPIKQFIAIPCVFASKIFIESMRKISFISLIISLLSITTVFGQEFRATAKLDSAQILIGDHLNIRLEVIAPKTKPVQIPQLNAKILEEAQATFEWIVNSKIDTLIENNNYKFSQIITITCFDSGSYVFPAIPIFTLDSQLVAQTNPLFFEVTTIPVDTTAAIKDIKDISSIYFSFHELWLYIKEYALLILVTILVTGIVIYLIVRYLKNKKKKNPVAFVKPKPKIKPHIIALKELEKLRQKKLWEQGRNKEYYTELVDIVRIYIDDKWEMGAMEMVSTEILSALNDKEIHEDVKSKLRQAFSIADLVKFAKWEPLPTEHDFAFKNCKEFVERTAEVNQNELNKEIEK